MKQKVDVKVDSALADKFNSGEVAGLRAGGVFSYELVRDGKIIDSGVSPNIVVDEGLEYILDVALSGGAQIPAFYIGIFSNNYTPIAGDTAATFVASAGEVDTQINEVARQVWTEAGVSGKTITNTASIASFTANTTVNVFGAFLHSDSAKLAVTGTLIAASRFAAVRNMLNTDVLNVTYTLTIADA